ncbi:MAG: TrbC family F-type conjugative pilus assembly protein (plasmid) [Candidatus Algichlamydia australiensis]|nr:TrbC family F-type conjugative pilus assembly protein [Chlamydiales bacterium]
MKKHVALFLLGLGSLRGEDDLKEIIKNSEKILESSHEEISWELSRCTSTEQVLETYNTAPKFLILNSFSVPVSDWLKYDADLQRMGGVFVIRGFPSNSVEEFVAKTRELKEAGLVSPIVVDPRAFKKYDVQRAPAFVVDDGRRFDVMKGATNMRYVVECFALEGDTSSTSRKYERIYKKIATKDILH